MISTAHNLSADERLSLESKIIHVTAPPLCLDPNPAVGILLNNIQAKKHRFSTAPLRRTCRKFSQVIEDGCCKFFGIIFAVSGYG